VAKKKTKTKTGPLAKQRATIYTMMLIFSFVALVLACVLMYLELKEYDFDIEAKDYRSVFHVPAMVVTSETIV
jgi:cell division protein FtsL